MEPIYELENKLEVVISENDAGEYDGHEISMDYSAGTLFLYGPNAEKLFKLIQPILKNADCLVDVKVKLRFGPPEDGVKEIEFEI